MTLDGVRLARRERDRFGGAPQDGAEQQGEHRRMSSDAQTECKVEVWR